MKAKIFFTHLALVLLQFLYANILFAEPAQQTYSMTFRSYIDGSDYIHVRGNEVWYVHRNFQLPGKWNGANEPTYINGNSWFPAWPGNTSSKYTMLTPPLASTGISDVTIEKTSARGTLTLTQIPDAANGYEAIILADDDPQGGPDWYEFKLKWSVQGFTPCSNLPSDLRQNLVAYYPFCHNANDVSGNNNNPSFNNATLTSDRFGNPNSAYSFDGSQFMKGSCSNYPVNNRTISIWFKINDLSRHNILVAYGGGDCGSSFFADLNHGSHPQTYTVTGHCEVNNCFTTDSYPPPSGWNSWIITSGNNVTKFYLNGLLIHTCDNADFKTTGVSGKDFAFGACVNPAGIAPYSDWAIDYLNGSLDDIVIYNTVLDEAKVKELYQYFSGGQSLQQVTSFTLINADTDKDIQLIEDGSTIDINTLPTTKLNIRANVKNMQANASFKKPGSVVFILDGKQVRTEEGAPFAIGGDLPTGDYHAWTLPIGEHTLTAIPYERSNGGGLKGKSLTIHFNVIANTACINSVPVKKWDKRFGGNFFQGYFTSIPSPEKFPMLNTADSGYLIGNSVSGGISGDKTQDSRGKMDYWIIKTGKNGNKLWDKRFGGDDQDILSCMLATSDGGYLLGGTSLSGTSGDKTQNRDAFGNYTLWIVKIDANGNKLWDRQFEGDGGLTSMLPTSDGGYLLGGATTVVSQADQALLVKIDSVGNEVWRKSYDGAYKINLYSMEAASDGGFLLGGPARSAVINYNWNYWVIKVDASGNKLWNKQFGGSGDDFLNSIKGTPDKGFLLGGTSASGISGNKSAPNQGLWDYWVVKIDSLGNKVWDKTFGGSNYDELSSILLTADGRYLLGGTSSSGTSTDKSQPNCSEGYSDDWLIKIDSEGNKLWDMRVGGDSSDVCYSLLNTKDGGILLGGYSSSGVSCEKSQPPYLGYYTSDYWIVKLDCGAQQNVFSRNSNNIRDEKVALITNKLRVYPNPSTGNLSVTYSSATAGKTEIKVYDMLGRIVFDKTGTASKGINNYQLNLTNVVSGTYNLQLINANEQKQARFVIAR